MTSGAQPADIVIQHRPEDLDPEEIALRVQMLTQTIDYQLHLQAQRDRGANPPNTLENNFLTAPDIQALSTDIPLDFLEAIGSTGGDEWTALPAEIRRRRDQGWEANIRYGISLTPDTQEVMYVIGAFHQHEDTPGINYFTGAGFTIGGITYLFSGRNVSERAEENYVELPRHADPDTFLYCGFSPEALPSEVLAAVTHILEAEHAMSQEIELPAPVDTE